MSKVTSELASTPTQGAQPSLSFKKPPAPAKKSKKQPDQYVFRLTQEHPKSHEGASVFPPRFTVTNQDNVLFNYGTEEETDFRPRQIRYLDGYPTIFVDEQIENGPISDSITGNPKNTITFENGSLIVPSWNKQLYQFLLLSNQCEQNTNKLRMVKNVYKLLDFANSDEDSVEKGKKKDRAYDVARNATIEEMIPHAKYLGISFIHHATGEERDYDAIREDYKTKALESPESFLLYANNPKVKTMYLISKGLESGIITTGMVRGQLHWSATKQFIANIDISKKAIDAITDYAMTDEAESFIRTLKAQIDI